MREQERNPYIQQRLSPAEVEEGIVYTNDENGDSDDDFAATITTKHDENSDEDQEFLLPSRQMDSMYSRLFGTQRMR